MKIYDLLTYQGFPADFVTVSHTRVFVRSCDVNPADLEGPAHLTFSEPGLFVHEQVQASTLCQIRKSRAVTRGMRSFPLLLSAALRQVCLYVCERERRNQRDGRECEEKTSESADKGAKEPARTLVWPIAVCASRQNSGGCLLSSYQGVT